MEIEKEMLKGYIEVIILALLSKRDYYGYELGKTVKEQTGRKFELKEGTLYLAFKRMESNGYISSYWSGEDHAGNKRRYYRITPEGTVRLRLKKAEWDHLREIIDLFLKGV